MSNVIDQQRLHDICKVGQGAASCKYITASSQGICCEKHTPFALLINERTDMVAKGDNCEGLWP